MYEAIAAIRGKSGEQITLGKKLKVDNRRRYKFCKYNKHAKQDLFCQSKHHQINKAGTENIS
jgi:hypothetical protein